MKPSHFCIFKLKPLLFHLVTDNKHTCMHREKKKRNNVFKTKYEAHILLALTQLSCWSICGCQEKMQCFGHAKEFTVPRQNVL